MAKDQCRYHAAAPAVGSCRQCAIPLCHDCAISKPEGIFCSGDCYDKYARFQKGAEEYDEKLRKYRRRPNFKKWIVAAAVVIGLAIFFHMVYGVSSVGDLPAAAKEIWADIIDLF